MARPAFIRAMHPKAAIRPDPGAISRVLATGWVGQLKIHGHRAQIHIPAAPEAELVAFTRKGTRHKVPLSATMIAELRRLLSPQSGWNVVDCEWVKEQQILYLFDMLKKNSEVLSAATYPERYAQLPQLYLSPALRTLPLLTTLDKCLAALKSPEPWIEGLVFKSSTSTGFLDTAIVRCRKSGS